VLRAVPGTSPGPGASPAMLTASYRALGLALPGSDLAAYRKTNVETQQSALKEFADRLAPQLQAGQKFRFSYCSGKFAERDATKKLRFLQKARRIRVSGRSRFRRSSTNRAEGESETVVLQAAEDHPKSLETYVLRPAPVVAKTSNLVHAIVGKNYTIKADDLAAAMLESAMYGSATQIEESKEVSLRGRKFLDAQSK
jgi:hypothetical protein